MLELQKKVQRLLSEGKETLILNRAFIVGRKDFKLFILLNDKFTNNPYNLGSELIKQFNSDIKVGCFGLIKVNEINYIFKLNERTEKHIFAVLQYTAKNNSDLLNSSNLSDLKILENGDILNNQTFVYASKIDLFSV